ncbi:transmembrane protein 39A-like [Macrobrachium nipponense]|uniref:transmembrane protein 39A-like n=1 Tax=Macrobrachium nipponense TaxID=159736 RepID=UPI0030C8504C
MAGGRRNASRAPPPKPVALVDHELKRLGHSADDGPPLMSITPPKHMTIPDIPRISELGFEVCMLVFSLMSLALQYLNIYRTVFWLPHSHTKYAMNLYLIDRSVVWFIVVTLSRRVCWSILKLAIMRCFHQSLWKSALSIARVVFVCVIAALLGFCLYTISDALTYIKILALGYPFVFYIFIFDMEITSFLEVIPVPANYKEEGTKNRQAVVRLIQHSCLSSADAVRGEVEFLTNDCNRRMAQVMYQTIVIVYYTTLIPCFFVPSSLYYDVSWVTLHTLFVATTCFMWHLLYCYPARYCDVLHRSSMHLGGWARVEGRSAHAPYNPWSNSVLWPQGALVKHNRELYRAEGATNAAEPGNTTHARLYAIFYDPSRPVLVLVWICVCCVLLHLVLLASLHQWHQLLATALVLTVSYAALYHLLRDYLVLRKVYQQEQQLQERIVN